jgi:hypothetical protein
MEGGVIYSRDGRTFAVTSTTRVVNNASQHATSMRIAELAFENGRLVTVTIK